MARQPLIRWVVENRVSVFALVPFEILVPVEFGSDSILEFERFAVRRPVCRRA